MISLGTIWIRTGVMHRTWGIVTCALALVLLLKHTLFRLGDLYFPGMGNGGQCLHPAPKTTRSISLGDAEAIQ